MEKLKKKLKLPVEFVYYLLICIGNYAYDMFRFMKHSSLLNYNSRQKLEARIIAHAHSIERGLSLSECRSGFGVELRDSLLNLLNEYIARGYDISAVPFVSAINVLKFYISNQNATTTVIKTKRRLDQMLLEANAPLGNANGGTQNLTKELILKKSCEEFSEFAVNRFSIRDFTSEIVSVDEIGKAVKIAQKSPSVCNRQSSKVYVAQSKRDVALIGNMHSGVGGFSASINTFLIVTSDLQSFFSFNERNQVYIDGGLFSMSLLYALHNRGLGACALNWAVDKKTDAEFRAVIPIPESENIILLIAVGHLPDVITVPVSARRRLDEVIRIL